LIPAAVFFPVRKESHVFPHSWLVGLLLLVPGSLVINEFVVRPADEEGEWIELRNAGAVPIPLGGWGLRDATGTVRRIPEGTEIEPGGFLVLASRPDDLVARFTITGPVIRPDGWGVLNDRDAGTGQPADVIALEDAAGILVDSLAYFEAWLPPDAGRSLERGDPRLPGVDPGAWGWSVDPAGATPGRVNSLVAPGSPAADIWTGPDTVQPSRAPSVFRFRFEETGTLGISLVDEGGREVALLQAPVSVSPVGQWVWGSGSPLPPRRGRYFLCLRWQGAEGTPVRRCRPVWVEP
jgi:hypothetical protein